jgi:small-conductance mechanosensitive channel
VKVMLAEKILITLAVISCAVAFRAAAGWAFKRRLRGLAGYRLLANTIAGVLGIGLALYLLYLWNVVGTLLEMLATFGLIATVFLWTIKDVWLSNLFAGLSLIGDRLIGVGSEVEISGKRGRIVEMTLTLTKMRTAEGDLVVVPNKKFREEAVVVVGGSSVRSPGGRRIG